MTTALQLFCNLFALLLLFFLYFSRFVLFDVTPLCLCDNNWSQWQTANYKLKVTKITTRIPGESTHRGAITIQARRYSNDIGGERRIMTTENSATTVTTRMKWNLILKQAFDHRCCMLATFAIVAAANVDCNSVDVASERAWHFCQSSASGKVVVVVVAVATPRQQRHTL